MTVEWSGDSLLVRVRASVMQAIVRGTELVVEEADSLQNETPRTGRTYRRRGVTHVASSPGNAPAPDTGALRQSVHSQFAPDELTGVAVANAAYAAALEFGTERISPRPFMRPALEAKRAEIEGGIRDAVAEGLR